MKLGDRDALAERLLSALSLEPEAQRRTPKRLKRMAGVASRRLASVCVVLENLWDPHNVSAVVRTAEGLGLDRLHVVEDPHPYKRHPAILHGADRWIDIVRHPTLEGCLQGLERQGFVVCAADLGEGCVPLGEIPVEAPVAVVLGSEKAGLTQRAKALAELRFTIPMAGFTGSFNVSVSAAVALWELSNRRRRYLGVDGDLSEEAALARVRSWLGDSRS